MAGNNNNSRLSDLEMIEKKKDIDEKFQNNYVDKANEVISTLNGKIITKTKLRSIYNMLCNAIDREKRSTESDLKPDSLTELKMFRVHVIYDCGRYEDVKNFVIKSGILGYYADIGNSKVKFQYFCKYFEALIAYHRFLYNNKD